MHIILTGATGLVGTSVLSHILTLPASQIQKVSILSRKPVPLAEDHANCEVIIHHNYGTYPESVLEKLKGANAIIWAQGVSQNDVNRDEYIKITRDWPLAAAKAFEKLPSDDNTLKFIYVSGEGATTTPSQLTPLFGRIKGQAEAALLSLSKTSPTIRAYSVRPGYVDPQQHPEIHPLVMGRRTGLMMRFADTAVAPIWRRVAKGQKELGKVLTELAMRENGGPLEGVGIEGEGRTVRNSALRSMAGLA
ncbi:MAG: hypothetical protein Q9227_007963 [Pyrenula ochraceoflavens]